ncbi:Tf2-8, partial [Mucuna pruriens]
MVGYDLRLTNALSTFMRSMNHILRSLIGKCVYLDDILVYSSCIDDHILHVRSCFFGYVVGFEGVKVNSEIVEHLASPLNKIVKKDVGFKLEESQERAFQTLKERLTNTPILSLSEVHNYLLLKEFKVHNGHEALKYLRSQNKLSKRQAKWVEFLEQFPYVIKHKQGKTNIVVDSLSRKHSLLSMLETKLLDKKLCVPKNCVRGLSVTRAHEGGLMGHFKEYKTYKNFLEHFFWLHMKRDVHHICDKCIVSTKSKFKPYSFYSPFPITTMPWVYLSMDFVLGLPRSKSGKDSIIVVVNKFSGMVHFIPCHRVYD